MLVFILCIERGRVDWGKEAGERGVEGGERERKREGERGRGRERGVEVEGRERKREGREG